MIGDETHDRSGTGPEEPIGVPDHAERPEPVLAAYDAVKEVDSFILAAVDRDDAWLAVETGVERDLERWR